jgi:hypothetical protein
MRAVRLAGAICASIAMLVASAPTVAAVGAPPPYQIYVVDNIYSRYTGYTDTDTGRACRGPCTIAKTESYTWSNSWGANITFTKAPVQAQVSFNVSYSETDSYTYTFPVPAGVTDDLRFQDLYHVTLMHVHTATCYSGVGCSNYKYGTAFAQEWFRRTYYVVAV